MRAKELSFTGRRVSGREAVTLGLALEAAPSEGLEARVTALADVIAANIPRSVAAYKDLYRGSQESGLTEGLALEANYRPARRGDERVRRPLSDHLKRP